jgi:hypothetical protein
MPPSPTRAWISYRPSMTLPTNGSPGLAIVISEAA